MQTRNQCRIAVGTEGRYVLAAEEPSAPEVLERLVQQAERAEASDIHLTHLQPGWVYGTYRYRVRYGAEEHSGISERLFVKTPKGWRVKLVEDISEKVMVDGKPMKMPGGGQ